MIASTQDQFKALLFFILFPFICVGLFSYDKLKGLQKNQKVNT